MKCAAKLPKTLSSLAKERRCILQPTLVVVEDPELMQRDPLAHSVALCDLKRQRLAVSVLGRVQIPDLSVHLSDLVQYGCQRPRLAKSLERTFRLLVSREGFLEAMLVKPDRSELGPSH